MRKLLGQIRRRLRPRQTRPVILMYHRVARPPADPWGLAVTPERFGDQMRMLRQSRTPLAMTEFVDRLQAGTLPADAAAVTFDDGYRDNLAAARPLLAAEGIPATVFIATGHVGSPEAFWWDELAELLLARSQAADCDVLLPTGAIRITLPPIEADRRHDTGWNASTPPISIRQRVYLSLWQTLRGMDDGERIAAMASIRSALGGNPANAADCAMSAAEIGQLVDDGAIAIGGHTVTHPPLSSLPAEAQRSEIATSMAACEQLAGGPIDGFAYPYGDHDETTKRLVKESGARWACSTREAALDTSRFDLFSLPRIQVRDWSGAHLSDVLRNQWIGA